MNNHEIHEILVAAIEQLWEAVNRFTKQTNPATPKPRIRTFEFCDAVRWPHRRSEIELAEGGQLEDSVTIEPSSLYHRRLSLKFSDEVALIIIESCGKKPRLTLRALRRIQAATAWCEARTKGRKREAQEILRQQAKAVEALEAEAAMLALKKEIVPS